MADSVTYQITSPHFVTGLVCIAGECVEAAPILEYMHVWRLGRVENYCKGKGWKMEKVA